MSETFSTKGLKALFSYPVRQDGWERKLLIFGALILAGYFLPIIPWIAAAGYTAEVIRRTVSAHGEPELPEWTQWDAFFVDGLRMAGVALIFSLPLLLLFACGFGPYLTSLFALIISGDNQEAASAFLPMMMGSSFLIMLTALCGFGYSLLIGIPLPAAVVDVIVKRSFMAVFKISGWWKVFRANIGGFIIASLLVWAISFVMQMVTQVMVSSMVLCALAFIAPVALTPFVAILSAYLYGQAYREGLETLGLDTSQDSQPLKASEEIETAGSAEPSI